MALNQRKPANDLLWHSDRGSQYASESHRALLTANGITQTGEGVLIFDDTLQEKPHSKENDLICWHYDHCVNRSVKGIIKLLLATFRNQQVTCNHSLNDVVYGYKNPRYIQS
jgi:transposase InsO family protein